MDNLINEFNQLKDELIQKTLNSLLEEGQNQFDLTTIDGIKNGVEYFVKYHYQRVIENGKYQFTGTEDRPAHTGETF